MFSWAIFRCQVSCPCTWREIWVHLSVIITSNSVWSRRQTVNLLSFSFLQLFVKFITTCLGANRWDHRWDLSASRLCLHLIAKNKIKVAGSPDSRYQVTASLMWCWLKLKVEHNCLIYKWLDRLILPQWYTNFVYSYIPLRRVHMVTSGLLPYVSFVLHMISCYRVIFDERIWNYQLWYK